MAYTVHGILQARILEWAAFPFSRGSFQPRDQTQVSRIAGEFFYHLSQQGKPKITGVGSLSLLQLIFLTQESIRGLLHRRRILYQLSYWGSPKHKFIPDNFLAQSGFLQRGVAGEWRDCMVRLTRRCCTGRWGRGCQQQHLLPPSGQARPGQQRRLGKLSSTAASHTYMQTVSPTGRSTCLTSASRPLSRS